MIRMSRRAVLAAGFAPALPLKAEDPWTTKKPSELTDEELTRILSDSPWAQKVELSFRGPDISSSSTPGFGMSGPGSRDFAAGGPGASGPGRRISGIPFVVRWVSAAPVKEAYVRVRLGKDVETSQQAKDYLGKAERHYAIALIGPPVIGWPRWAPKWEGTEGGALQPGQLEKVKQRLKNDRSAPSRQGRLAPRGGGNRRASRLERDLPFPADRRNHRQ